MTVNDINVILGTVIGSFSALMLAGAAFLNSRNKAQKIEMQQSITDNATNIDLFKKENDQQKLLIERLLGKLDARDAELEKKDQTIFDMRLELSTVKGQLSEMSIKDKIIESLKEEMQGLRDQMKIMHEENETLRNQVNILNNKLNII